MNALPKQRLLHRHGCNFESKNLNILIRTEQRNTNVVIFGILIRHRTPHSFACAFFFYLRRQNFHTNYLLFYFMIVFILCDVIKSNWTDHSRIPQISLTPDQGHIVSTSSPQNSILTASSAFEQVVCEGLALT